MISGCDGSSPGGSGLQREAENGVCTEGAGQEGTAPGSGWQMQHLHVKAVAAPVQ